MNHQADILRKTLEGLSEKGAVSHYFGHEISEIGLTHGSAGREIADQLLNHFPEEDSEDVKAYRALVTLVRYLETSDLETGHFVDDYTIEEQLCRLRPKIGDQAEDDIFERLEVDECEISPGVGTKKSIHDPISKLSYELSITAEMERAGDPTDGRKQHFAREILEKPL